MAQNENIQESKIEVRITEHLPSSLKVLSDTELQSCSYSSATATAHSSASGLGTDLLMGLGASYGCHQPPVVQIARFD